MNKLFELRALARQGLGHYDIAVARIRLASRSTNAVFRVTSVDGHAYALRLAAPGWRSLLDLQSEALWLEALARDTAIGAPAITRTRTGEAVATLSGGAHVTLMDWLPGQLLGKHLTMANVRKMGVLFAALHQHGATWRPPAGFTQRRFTCYLARGEDNVIFAPDTLALAPPASEALLRALVDRVNEAYAALDPADLRVIHCDLWHDNIKLHRGRLLPFDFEDTIWGYRLHDIAMAMLDLQETAGYERYLDLLTAFRAGYSDHLDWPAGDMNALQMGRRLWRFNYVARFQHARLAEHAQSFVADGARYLAHPDTTIPFRWN